MFTSIERPGVCTRTDGSPTTIELPIAPLRLLVALTSCADRRAVCCRLQSIDEENGAGEPFLVADDPPERLEAQQKLVDDACTPKQLYIMTLSCLPAYRRRGLASSLLNFVLEGVKKRKDVKEIGLHVQVTNEEAIAFYEKHGFHKKKEIPDYYTAIQPTAAYYLAYTVDVQ